MFNFVKSAFKKIYENVTEKTKTLFSKTTVDKSSIAELEKILITADVGLKTSRELVQELEKQLASGELESGDDLRRSLQELLIKELEGSTIDPDPQPAFLLVGINGSGKTTLAGKLAKYCSDKHGGRVLMAAADTFRAAAPEQLTEWATRSNSEIYTGKPGQDPASVAFEACQRFETEDFQTLIIDTAGRVQTNTNLVNELVKIKKVASKKLGDKPLVTLLTVDAMLGQNSLEQAKIFHQNVGVDGIVLTKMDATAKGGIVFAIARELGIPIAFVTFGETLDQISGFSTEKYVEELIG